MFKEQFEEKIKSLHELLMDKIEHCEVSELFERTRDFECEIYGILERIDFKDRSGNLI